MTPVQKSEIEHRLQQALEQKKGRKLKESLVSTQFMQFVARYGRSYASKSDFDVRFEIFAANLAAIEDHNSQDEITHTKGIN
jgi:hypothetical protein